MLKKIRAAYSNICVNNREFLKQLLIIELYIVLFWNAALFSEYSKKNNYVWILFWTVFFNGNFWFTVYSLVKKKSKIHLKEYIFKNFHLILIFLVFFLVFLTVSDSWLNLDGFIYYAEIRNLKQWDFVHFSELMIAGHWSQGYTMLAMVGEYLFPDQVIGVRLIHLIMAFIAIYCFDRIISKIMKDSDKMVKILCTAIFSFNPMLLGLIAEINTDFPLLCIMTWMFYCSIYEKYILQAFCSFLLCFSKEPGIILCLFFLFGIMMFRVWKNRKNTLKKKLLSLLSKDVILNILPFFLVVFCFVKNSNIGWLNNAVISEFGETNLINNVYDYRLNSFSVWPEYIIRKFLGLFGMNFSWILYILVLIEIICIIMLGKEASLKKIKIKSEILIGIFYSFIGFMFYNCTYITYTHYRYLLPLAFFSTFGLLLSIDDLISKVKIQRFFLTILVSLIFVSNFVTIDPLSKIFFKRLNTGVTDIINPNFVFDLPDGKAGLYDKNNNKDPINCRYVYNLEYAYIGKCFDQTLKKIEYNQKKAIIIPWEYDERHDTLSSLFGITQLSIHSYYWDTVYNHININTADKISEMINGERYQLLNIYPVEHMNDIDESILKSYEELYYIELPWIESFDHNQILNHFQIENQFDIQYISWRWKVDKIAFSE